MFPNTTLLQCKCCGKHLPIPCFSPHKECVSGYDVSRCKPCKKSKSDWRKTPLNKRILNRLRTRAKEKNLTFNLELADIVLPETCPIFGHKFVYGDIDWTYSVDRFNPELGYVKGNIQIISNRANRLKNNASADEIEKLYKWMNAEKERKQRMEKSTIENNQDCEEVMCVH